MAEVLAVHGPRTVAALARWCRDIERSEEAVQEAALRALERWPTEGVPDAPAAWLRTVAKRLIVDAVRAGSAEVGMERLPEAEAADQVVHDPRLGLLFACCHPAIEPRHQVALALRSVCGVPTARVAAALLMSPTVLARQLKRTSDKIRDLGIAFSAPDPDGWAERLAAVLTAIYLLFHEGYAGEAGQGPAGVAAGSEAVRLAGMVVGLLRQVPEVRAELLAEAEGLWALLLLHHARRSTRWSDQGAVVPLDAQDRTRWDRAQIDQGVAVLDQAMARGAPGAYQLQAAIAALHAQAPRAEDTDWAQITALYGALLQHQPTPVVELNAAVALSMSAGAARGLAWVDALIARKALVGFHLVQAVRGDFLQRLGRSREAAEAFSSALSQAQHPAERAHLRRRRAEVLAEGPVLRRRRARQQPRRTALTDREWSRVAHLVVQPKRRGRPPRPAREVLEAVLWVLATGAPWRELPSQFGPWQTAYHRFRQWELDGTMAALWQRLRHHPSRGHAS